MDNLRTHKVDPWDWALYAGDKILQLPDADGPDALAKAKALMGV